MIYITIATFSFYIGLRTIDFINYIKDKYKLEKYNKIFKKIRDSEMKSENFLYRINNTCYFKFDDIYLNLSFNNDMTYSYINIVGDSSFNEIIYSSYLDDKFNIVEKEETLLIDCLLKFYSNEIADIKSYGGYFHSSKMVDKQINDTIALIKLNLEKDNIVSVTLLNDEEFYFEKKTENSTELKITQIDIDSILDQISENGIESLTDEQKNILNNYNTDK